MPNRLRDQQRIEHILEAINFCLEEIENISKEDFLINRVLGAATERQLEIIGEATNNLSDELIRKYNSVEWRRIIAFRNFVAHEYFKIDYDIIWRIIKTDLPILKEVIETIIKNEKF